MQRPANSNLLGVARDYIRNYIAENNLKGGDPLPTEKELSSALGLSRTVIREALKGLQELGVTESIQGKGHFLREFNFHAALVGFDFLVQPSLKSFRDLLEIRMYLESVFLARDAFLFTDGDFAELDSIVDEIGRRTDIGAEESDLIDIHTLFHKKLYSHSGNAFLMELISLFSSLQHKFVSIHGYRTSDRQEFVREHRKIVDTLKCREPEMVRGVLISHFSEPLSWVQRKIAAEIDRTDGQDGGKA